MLVEVVILLVQLVLLGGATTFVALGLAWCLSGHMDAPFVPTPKRILPLISDALEIRDNDVVYDLGCGDGRLLFYCSRKYPSAKFVGIEHNPVLMIFNTLKRAILKVDNLTFRGQNIYDADFSDATRIYTYLFPDAMNRLFASWHPKAGSTRLITRAFKITGKPIAETIPLPDVENICGDHEIHVYDLK